MGPTGSFRRTSTSLVSRLRCQLAFGSRGAVASWPRGLAARLGLALEEVAARNEATRRLDESLRAVRVRRAWKRRLRRYEGRFPLEALEARHYSQGGEDGVIEAIFAAIGTTNRTFLEIGSSDGSENCTRWLAEQGWTGVWMEADPASVARARGLRLHGVEIVGEPAEPATIRRSLERTNLPPSPDLLVVDIDGNDWWVLGAALEMLSPRVLVVEYNASFPPGRWWVMPYRRGYRWPGTYRHGASLDALAALAASKDLLPVGCSSNGVNAFFVDAGAPHAADLVRSSPRECYVEPRFGTALWGHPRAIPPPAHAMPQLGEPELRRVAMDATLWPFGRKLYAPREPIVFTVTVRNEAPVAMTSVGPFAVQIALRWREQSEGGSSLDWTDRVPFLHVIEPGKTWRTTLWHAAPTRRGPYWLDLCLVQENTMWLTHTSLSFGIPVG